VSELWLTSFQSELRLAFNLASGSDFWFAFKYKIRVYSKVVKCAN